MPGPDISVKALSLTDELVARSETLIPVPLTELRMLVEIETNDPFDTVIPVPTLAIRLPTILVLE